MFMRTYQVVPNEYDVPVFNARVESANGIPNLTSFFYTIYNGMEVWYRDNLEGKINATVQIFGAPFSVASNLFNISIRGFQVGAVLGLQNTESIAFFKPMAISGLVVAILEAFYHLYGLSFQLNFGYNFYQRNVKPLKYFSYLFQEFLGADKKDDAENTEKMFALARRIQPWLVKEITQTLSEHPKASEKQILEWMNLIEIQMKKKIILHCLALTTITALGIGLALALAGAAPLVSVILLGVSPLFTAAQYFFENGFLITAGWRVEWRNCVPMWVRSVLSTLDTSIEEKLKFTPGQRA